MFRVLKTFDRWVRRNGLKENTKRFLFSRVDAVETTGPDGAAYAMKYGTLKERIHVLPHVFNVAAFIEGSRRAREHRDASRKSMRLVGTTYIYVGRLWRKKGVEDLINAFARVQRDVDIPVSLFIVGDGPDEVALRSYAESLRLSNVVFAGFRDAKELPELFAASDVFVFPTWGDPYGLVVDEAMVCGLPVISTDAAGEIRERITEGENGYVVGCGEIQAMADAMIKLSQNVDLRHEMGANGIGRIVSHSPPLWAENFERAVEAVFSIQEKCSE